MISEFHGEHRWLSNFWPCTVVYRGVAWPSSEHAYVAAKVDDTVFSHVVSMILDCHTSGAVKRLGRKLPLRADWDQVRLQAMTEILADKFTRNKDLQELLLATGDQELIEGNHWGDTFWGVCKGVGTNHLGRLLMELRAGLRSSRTQESPEAP